MLDDTGVTFKVYKKDGSVWLPYGTDAVITGTEWSGSVLIVTTKRPGTTHHDYYYIPASQILKVTRTTTV